MKVIQQPGGPQEREVLQLNKITDYGHNTHNLEKTKKADQWKKSWF